MVTSYNVISKDGYIARKDGSEDFIPDSMWNDFIELCKKHDAVVIGRKTYVAIQAYEEALIKEFESLPTKKIVVSKNKDFKPKEGYLLATSPADAASHGEKVLLCSGPGLNSAFYAAGLIDKVMLNVLPVEIGEGIQMFHFEPKLELISEEKRSQSTLQTYQVIAEV